MRDQTTAVFAGGELPRAKGRWVKGLEMRAHLAHPKESQEGGVAHAEKGGGRPSGALSHRKTLRSVRGIQQAPGGLNSA